MAHRVQPVRPADAASIILLRQPHFVYMTARPDTLRVAAGYYVFPGGRVDPEDEPLAVGQGAAWRVPGLEPSQHFFIVAALRELFEEVGLLLAVDRDGRPLWRPEGAGRHRERLAAARTALNEEGTPLADVLHDNGWTLSVEPLAYLSRWVTPTAARRRFNTCFFVADVTGCIDPVPYKAEVARGEWVALSDTLKREEAGTLPLLRPTRSLLYTLAGLGDVEQVMDRYKRVDADRMEMEEPNAPEVLRAVLASQGVTVVPVPSATLLPATETNVYIVKGGGEALIIDAADGAREGTDMIAEAWKRAGRPRVQAVVLTHNHPDHAGGLQPLLDRFDWPLAAHKAGAAELQQRYGIQPDIVLRGGESFTVGRRNIEVIHSPGHAPDHISLFERETGLLFSGDNIVGEGSTWVGPPAGRMEDYLQSLADARSLPLRVIAPGHGPLLDDPFRRIDELVERRLRREAHILSLIKKRPRTVSDLFDRLYKGEVPESVAEMARRTVCGHMQKLERDGLIEKVDRKGGEGLYGPIH